MAEKKIVFSLWKQETTNSSPIIIKGNAEESVKSLLLGSLSFIQPCGTCNLTTLCPGHFGKFEIKKPIFKSAFKSELENVLKFICPVCGFIKNDKINDLLDKINQNNNIITLEIRQEFDNIINENKYNNKQTKIKCKNKNCQIATTPIQYNQKISSFIYSTDIKRFCETDVLLSYLQKIPKNFLQLLNYKSDKILNVKDVFYHKYLLIPSNYSRQPNNFETISFDAFTSDLNSFVKLSSQTTNQKKAQKLFDIIDNDQNLGPYTTQNRLTLSTLTNGSSKDSFLRNTINGKRIFGTARSVIGPGVKLPIGFISTSSYINGILKECIYYNNITKKHITENLNQHNSIYKEIKFYNYKDIDFVKSQITNDINYINQLNYGDFLEREKHGGDFICFSRQPSIHKWNFQASEIDNDKNDSHTTAIAIPITSSQGADFDGDEMLNKTFYNPSFNIEAGLILNSKNLLKHDVVGTTMYGLVQDQIIGFALLYKETSLSLIDASKIFGKYFYIVYNYPIQNQYTGAELLSMVFPDHFSYPEFFENGKLILKNISSENVISNSYKSIFNILSHYYNNGYVITIIDIIKTIVQNYIKHFGFCVTFSDIVPNVDDVLNLEKERDEKVNEIDLKLHNMIDDIQTSDKIILAYDEFFDIKMNEIQKLKEYFTSKIVSSIYKDPDNIVVKCLLPVGFKFSYNDILNILCFVSQKPNKDINVPKINGKTGLYTFQNNFSLESTGFIKHSYISGLKYNDFVFMIKAESLPQIVNVTSGTSESGYLGKKNIRLCSGFILNIDRFITTYKYIINFNPFFYKISVSEMSKIKIIYPSKEMIWYEKINNIFQKHIFQFLLIKNVKSYYILKEIDFVLNLSTEIKTFYYKNKNKKLKPDHENNYNFILDMHEYIEKQYFFNLNNLNILLYVFLIYFDPSGFIFQNDSHISKVNISNFFTIELLKLCFEKIIFKLKYSLSPGYSFGYEISHTIQERITQQNLSSFQTTTKVNSIIEEGLTEKFKKIIEITGKDREEIITCTSYNKQLLLNLLLKFEYVSFSVLCSTIEIIEYVDKKCIYKCQIPIILLKKKNLNLIILQEMINKFCLSCFIINEFYYYINIDQENQIINIYLHVLFELEYKNTTYQPNILKHYLRSALLDGIHKGKQVNSNLSINSFDVEKLIEEDGEYIIQKKKLFQLQFHIENIDDLENIDTTGLEDVFIPPRFSYVLGGNVFLKYNTNGKANHLINDINFVFCLKHYFDIRFCKTKLFNIKSIFDKNEIIKQANNGNSKIIVESSFKNSTDPCQDIYSSLLVSQKPWIGTNYYSFPINPNLYDQLEYKREEELINLNKTKIISIL